jgi:hypothetical protein
MMDSDAIRSVVETYRKYDWVLRRVLATPAIRERLDAAAIDETPVFDSDIDAAWFSRPPGVGPVTWEIRYLGEPAFALLTSVNEAEADFEDSLTDVERRLKDAIGAKSKSLTSA